MLLSIDKVLSLLAEGKDVKKIAAAAGVEDSDVVSFIEEARRIILKYDPEKIRKKISIKKKTELTGSESELFGGTDLSAVPVESSLKVYCAVSFRNDVFAAGVLIKDVADQLLGKIHYSLTERNEKEALLSTVLKSLRIASYFKTRHLRVYIDNIPLIRLVSGKDEAAEPATAELVSSVNEMISSFPDARIEILRANQNEGANYLSKKRIKKD